MFFWSSKEFATMKCLDLFIRVCAENVTISISFVRMDKKQLNCFRESYFSFLNEWSNWKTSEKNQENHFVLQTFSERWIMSGLSKGLFMTSIKTWMSSKLLRADIQPLNYSRRKAVKSRKMPKNPRSDHYQDPGTYGTTAINLPDQRPVHNWTVYLPVTFWQDINV